MDGDARAPLPRLRLAPSRQAAGWIRAACRALGGLVYPRECLACGAALALDAPGGLCRRCAAGIHYIGRDRCPRCGFPFGPHVGPRRGACPSCRPGLRFRRAVAAWRYEGPGRELVHRWKYRPALAGHDLLVERLADLLRGEPFTGEIDVVVAVPMHWRRRMVRRFNPSEVLAADAAKRLDLPYCRGALVRVRHTPSQVRLNRSERLENVRGAFRVRRPGRIAGQCVLLVDDVVTTCATVAECSRALRLAGARAVYVAALAR